MIYGERCVYVYNYMMIFFFIFTRGKLKKFYTQTHFVHSEW